MNEEQKSYDSKQDTIDHIQQVQDLIYNVITNLYKRSNLHDQSKLYSPEKEIFDEYTPKLRETTYNSDEYKSYLAQMKIGLDHHYANNNHHPEFYSNGIQGMSLLDLIEMICDWRAATLRHKDGDIFKSIEVNQIRFNYSDGLKQILLNTVKELKFKC